METTKVYLAGPVHHTDDMGKGWRRQIEEEWDWHPIEWVNPVAELEYDPDKHAAEYVVENDRELLEQCDAVLVGHTGDPTPGTWREVEWSISVLEIPVYIWVGLCPPEMLAEQKPFSPWTEEAGAISGWVNRLIDQITEDLVLEGNDDD